MKLFSEDEIREKVKINKEMIDEVAGAFTDLVEKDVRMPPIMRVDIPENNGEMDVKTAYIPGHDMFALKVSTGFFNNYELGLPSTGGLMMLINTNNGQPEAILLDNGYLTDVRTAAAGAVGADHLANKVIKKVGVIGAGAQARYQLEALREVRSFEEVMVYSLTKKRLLEFKQEVEESLDLKVTIAAEPKAVVENSEIVITTTPATEPVIQADWLHPGVHITAMGSDAGHKQELDPKILKQADLYVCDVQKQCAILGELRAALEKGLFSDEDVMIELGELTSMQKKGRQNESDITIVDLTGTGAQDTRIALYAYKKLTEKK